MHRWLTVLCLSFLLVGCDKLSDDYEHKKSAKFWQEHSEIFDPAVEADAAKLPIAEQYAVYRYGTEYFCPGIFLNAPLVASGSRAVPLLQSKLGQLNDSRSIWTIAIVLERMDSETYDVSADAQLSNTLWAAAERADGPYAPEIRQAD